MEETGFRRGHATRTYYARAVRIALVAAVLAGASGVAADPPARPAKERPDDLVDVASVIPDAVIDMRYATTNNFVGEVMYSAARCKLRRAVAVRLAKAARLLRDQDRRLLIWDCYRPRSVQQKLWDRAPDKSFVANPKYGSRHNRGAAIDLAIVDEDGAAVPLPTEYDDFTKAAYRVHALRGERGLEAKRLAAAMKRAGFIGIANEWWHYDAPDSARFELADEPL